MPRRPSLQFYPAEWIGNLKLRAATYADRGLWMDTICFLHDSDEYGLVRWDLKRLAGALGCHVNQVQSLVSQDILKGAPAGKRSDPLTYTDSHRVTHTVLAAQPGPIWFSSRMLIDDWRRRRDSTNGKDGGNPHLLETLNPPLNPPLKGKGERKSPEKGMGTGEGTNGHETRDERRAREIRERSARISQLMPEKRQ